ncbi:related to Exoribonuclease II [Ustilago bromivora]|uniref:Related to Exoribonuclease II n=1 Tax=Ustilago bromivora TaxID=307758 RepID=A0A1K0GA28_9BASI|nr:related to Exoribonuclease II [Ustilago bromivora]SYW86068.1 related to Exoribonuclease II [Ustilago bromivora]
MRLPTTPYRALLLDRSTPHLSRLISTSQPQFETWNQSQSSSPRPSNPKKRQHNEKRRQVKISNTLLIASRLGDKAPTISKETSDRYSGWKPTPGPSSRRNVGRPQLSRPASKSLSKAKENESIDILLGPHSAAVLTTPLLRSEDGPEDGISSRDFITPRRQLRPGDFVEVVRSNVSIGVVLPPPEDDAGTTTKEGSLRNLYVLVTSGEIVLYKEQDVMIQIPSFISPPLTQLAVATSKRFVVSTNSIDTPSNSDGTHDTHSSNTGLEVDPLEGTATEEEPIDIPRFEARASICNKLRMLERQKEKELRKLLPAFQSLFLVPQGSEREVGERMDLRTGTITTFEAARLLAQHSREDGEMTASTIYAAHSLLMSHPTHFLVDALSHRTSQLFSCRSKGERANHALISSWISSSPDSEGQKYIDSFCAKASKIRRYNETHPHNLTGEPRIIDPPSAELDINWTSEDRQIIEFLKASLGFRRELQEDTHGPIAMSIIKRAGGHFRLLPHPNTPELMPVQKASEVLLAEEECGLGKKMFELIGTDLHAGADLQHGLVMRFLTEIGALPPWQNPIQLDASFRSVTADDPQPESSQREGVAKKYTLSLDEEVEGIRNDFGKDHSVYVIDDESAFELDDGLSITPLEGGDKAWVHVHIADPTALVKPEDELGRRAERRFQTLYFPEARWAMLPDSFVSAGVGLREGKGDGEGQRVMTFSALVDLHSGLVEDTKLQPGLVHDIQTISYSRVSTLLSDQSGEKEEGKRQVELRLLLRAATLLSENRSKSTAFLAFHQRSSISVSPLPLPAIPSSASELQKPYFFAGFPTVTISLDPSSSPTAGAGTPPLAQFLVSELMVLAGRVAASYGAKHNVALAYRHQSVPESEEETEQILGMRTNLPGGGLVARDGMVGHGFISYEEILLKGLMVSGSGYSSSAAEHFSLGITGHTSAPNGTVRGVKDALTGGGYTRATSPLRRYPDMLGHWQIKHHLIHSRPRFSSADISHILPQLERQEITSKQLMRSANRFWLHCLLQRSLLDPAFTQGEEGREREWLKGPFTAKVMLSEVRINAATLLGKVRVQVDKLGIPADLEWGAGEEPPKLGDVFRVEPVAVIIAGIRSGLILRRV